MKKRWLFFGLVFLFALLFVNFLDARVVYETKEIFGVQVLQSPIWSIDYLKNPKDLFEFSVSWVQFHFSNFAGLSRFNNLVNALNAKAGGEIFSLGGFTFFALSSLLAVAIIFCIFIFSKKNVGHKSLFSLGVILVWGLFISFFKLFPYCKVFLGLLFSFEFGADLFFVFFVGFWIFVLLIPFWKKKYLEIRNKYLSFSHINSPRSSFKSSFKTYLKYSFTLFLIFAIPFLVSRFIPLLSGVVDVFTFGKLFYGSFWKLLVRSFVVSAILVFIPLVFNFFKKGSENEKVFEEALKREVVERIDQFQKGL
jgi:hypothetical protein